MPMQLTAYLLIAATVIYALMRLIPLIERLERESFQRAEAEMAGRNPEPAPGWWRDFAGAVLLTVLFLALIVLAFSLPC